MTVRADKDRNLLILLPADTACLAANAFEGTIHHEVIARQPARRELQSRQENTPSARSDDSVILSPRNNSRTEQGTAFRLYYLADRDDENINVIDVALIAYYRVSGARYISEFASNIADPDL